MPLRLGYLGGTFDPVHDGHLAVAAAARAEVELDVVRFMPAHVPPHKRGRHVTAARHRIAMIRRAITDFDGFDIDEREIARSGPSYTVDTMAEVRAENPTAKLFFLIGADSLHDLPKWREIEWLAQLVTFIVARRGGEDFEEARRQATTVAGLEWIELDVTPPTISSTEIRRRLRHGETIAQGAPASVIVYAREERLYVDSDNSDESALPPADDAKPR